MHFRRGVVCIAAIAALGSTEAGSARSLTSSSLLQMPAIELLPTVARPAVAQTQKELLHAPSHELIWAPATRRLVMMQVTAYCPCPICCGSAASGLTASGNYIDYNRGQFVAADPTLPFGTKLIIPGYAAAAPVAVIDRGSAIHGNRLDVFYPTHEQAKQWGRKSLPVTIVNE